jgi:histone H2B
MAPKAEKKPAKKVAKSTSSAAAKKRKLAKAETYKIYIYKVLKQVRAPCSPELSLL